MALVEVCFSPALFPFIPQTGNTLTVVIDILRATTSFCTAFDYGVEKIIPLNSLQQAFECKKQGHLVAAERDGLKPEFADFSNSAFDYMTDAIRGKTIYYTTTNGTEAIMLAKEKGKVAVASFLNYQAMVRWLKTRNEDIILLCAGWKNNFCIEDTLCAGAIAELLMKQENTADNQTAEPDKAFIASGDATDAAVLLWQSCNGNPEPLIKKSSHYKRLLKLGYQNVLNYSLESGRSSAIPVFYNDGLIDLSVKPQHLI
ncbi:MAG TPA: 2-phosphosulfolactate phosphatase [Lentimicrobium sp.]|nr:2-phosphosulfolactate phosphatase [Lentimicrobium sp.]